MDFGKTGRVYFKDHEGKRLYLKKEIWEKVTGRPERIHLKYNVDKIKASISEPHVVRKSSKDDNSRIIYGKVGSYRIRQDVEVPKPNLYLAIVAKDNFIKTMYITDRIKRGEVLWQPSQE